MFQLRRYVLLKRNKILKTTLCVNCHRKFTPIFDNHIHNGTESIVHGNEAIYNGSEFLDYSKKIYNYKCPYCNKYYKSGYCIK